MPAVWPGVVTIWTDASPTDRRAPSSPTMSFFGVPPGRFAVPRARSQSGAPYTRWPFDILSCRNRAPPSWSPCAWAISMYFTFAVSRPIFRMPSATSSGDA